MVAATMSDMIFPRSSIKSRLIVSKVLELSSTRMLID